MMVFRQEPEESLNALTAAVIGAAIESLLLELKATEGHTPLHVAQVLSYLKTTGLPLALLINFNVPALRHGIRRIARTRIPQ
jgi:GxxExxY protein